MSQASAQAPLPPFSVSKLIHTLIGLAIMLLGPLMASPEFYFPANPRLEAMGIPIIDGNAIIAMSAAGWTAATVFIGMLWLWVFVETFWSSLIGVLLIAFSPHFPLPQFMAQYMGNPTTFLIFFILFFSAALTKSNVVVYISNYLLTRKYLQGRPYMLMLAILIAAYAGAWFDGGLGTVFLIWPVTYLILTEAGYKPGDKVSTFMVGNVIAGLVFALLTNIIKGPVLFMSSGYTNYVSNNPNLGLEHINVASWTLFTAILCVITTILLFLGARFILKLDVEAIKNFDTEKLKNKPLPPMNWKQKTLLYLFAIYIAWMVIPSLLPQTIPFIAYCKSKAFAGSMALFAVMIIIKRKNEPLIKLPEVAAAVPWGLYFLLAAALYFGGILTNPKTNIPILLEMLISNALQGLDFIPFLLLTMLLAIVATNLMNSIVTGIIGSPIIASVALNYGFPALPIVVLFLFILMSAMLTPAAGVPGAMLHGNKEWLPGKAAMSYAVFFTIVISIVTVAVGIPLALAIF